MLRSKCAESAHRFGQFGNASCGGDGIAATLQTLTLSPYGTKVVHGMCSRTSVVEAMNIAAKHEDFALLQMVDIIGCDARAVVFACKTALSLHYIILRQFAFFGVHHVHLLEIRSARRTLFSPSITGANVVVAKFHHIFYCEQVAYTLHIVSRAHVGERPAIGFELLDEHSYALNIPFARSVLQAVGQNGNYSRSIAVIFYSFIKFG